MSVSTKFGYHSDLTFLGDVMQNDTRCCVFHDSKRIRTPHIDEKDIKLAKRIKHRGITISEECFQELAELRELTGIKTGASSVAYAIKRTLRQEKSRIEREASQ